VTTDVTARYTGSAPLISTDVNGLSVISGEQGAFLSIDAHVRANLTRMAELSFWWEQLAGQVAGDVHARVSAAVSLWRCG
jgi:hypothetical protein